MKISLRALVLWLASVLVAAAQSDVELAPDLGTMTSSNLMQPTNVLSAQAQAQRQFQMQLDLARQQRHERSPTQAILTLVNILETNAPPEFKRKALLELALATQDNGEFVKAQQIYAQFLQHYADDQSAPEVLLRQGLLFRQMGVNTMAISKFYSVMSTTLKLKVENLDYYKNLVLQAQTEIADTYYIQGEFTQAAEFYIKLLKADSPSLNKKQIEFKLIRSLSFLPEQKDETISRSQKFLESFPDYPDVPEVRFILAHAYTSAGRNSDALKQVLLLLQSQEANAHTNPELWSYWQRRTGNEIANQLYKEGDYLDALQIYQNLAALDPAPGWQAPALYQVGLVFEQLQQWQRASDTYDEILARRAEMTGSNAPPSLSSLCDMALWRKNYIAWLQKAHATDVQFQKSNLQPASIANTTAAK
ncbi:MAG TPA: tetratricopeptide repeat protein [Candidatus Cybelea sp.]|nr:tetratricopeptide repeat protein [Candidatus Cybelea sp.]